MILVDFSGTIIPVIQAHLHFDGEVTEEKIRHVVLMCLRSYRLQFMDQYGPEFVLACDGKNYWRREIFPYYKQKRRDKRKDSDIDWTTIYKYIDNIKQEIKENFHWPVVEVPECEADDIIAVLAKNNVLWNSARDWPITYTKEADVIIISRDQDFIQLQDEREKIHQYNPVDKKFYERNDDYLFEHVCKGCPTDGIPNILSPENSLAVGIRQKSITQKKLAEWKLNGPPEEAKERVVLNNKLINFKEIPWEIDKAIVNEYKSQQGKKGCIYKYFIKKGLRECSMHLQDFVR